VGQLVTLSAPHWNGPCDALTYGYQLNLGPNVPVASKQGGVCLSSPTTGAKLGPFKTPTLLRIFLTDTGIPGTRCDYTFYSDGSHGRITGTGPWTVDIRDSVFCSKSPSNPVRPAGPGSGNISLTISLSKPGSARILGRWLIDAGDGQDRGIFEFVSTGLGTYADRVIRRRADVVCPATNDRDGQIKLKKTGPRRYAGAWDYFSATTCQVIGVGPVTIEIRPGGKTARVRSGPPPGENCCVDTGVMRRLG
jgi:hypothetical protein